MALVNNKLLLAILYEYKKRRKAKYLKRIRTISMLINNLKKQQQLLTLNLALLNQFSLYVVESCKRASTKRSCRRFVRNTGWWETVSTMYNDARFKQTFRMSRETFYFILRKIEHEITKQFVTEIPIPAETRLAVVFISLQEVIIFIL